MKKFLTRPISELVAENPFVANYKKMWPFIKPYWFRAFLGLTLALPVGALDGTIALFMKYYTDDVLVDKNAAFAAYIPLAIIGFVLSLVLLKDLLNFDGKLDAEEIAKLVMTGLLGLVGGVAGTMLGGGIGGTIGFVLGALVSLKLAGYMFDNDGQLSK